MWTEPSFDPVWGNVVGWFEAEKGRDPISVFTRSRLPCEMQVQSSARAQDPGSPGPRDGRGDGAIPGRAGSTRGSSSRFPDQLMLLPRPGRPTLTHLPGPADTSRPLSGLRGPTPARRRAHSLLAPGTLEAPPCALSTTGCSHLFTRLSLSLDYELQGAHCLLPETTRRHTQNCSNTPGGAHGPGAGRPRRCGCQGRPSRRAQRQRLLPERSPCCPLCSLGTSAEWESSPETGGVGRLR